MKRRRPHQSRNRLVSARAGFAVNTLSDPVTRQAANVTTRC